MKQGTKTPLVLSLLSVFVCVGFVIPSGTNVVYSQTLEETNRIVEYCFLHADRVAMGENVTQDLVVAGLLPREYGNITCAQAQTTLDAAEGFRDFMDAYEKYRYD